MALGRSSYYKTYAGNNVKDQLVLDIMAIYEWAYRESTDALERMEEQQKMYENVVDPSVWPTMSQIPMPWLFSMVQKAIPDIMFYLFPDTKYVRLIPKESGVKLESVERSEWLLQYTARNVVRLSRHCIPTFVDCYKLGIGVGIIEPITVTPPATFNLSLFENGKQTRTVRSLQLADPRKSIRYRHLTPGQVIVTPDGTDFNGQDRASHIFFLDMYPEDEFRKLFKDQPHDGENVLLKGDPDTIIAEARGLGFQTTVSATTAMAILGGIDIWKVNQPDSRIPVHVPVLKVYKPNHHVWIANGTTVIFDQESTTQTLRCPLVKASAWPDGKRFYPIGIAEASFRMAIGSNVFLNALIDVLTAAFKPMMVYDKNKFGARVPERGPNATYAVTGSVDGAVAYAPLPPLPPQLQTVGDMIHRMLGSVSGQESYMEDVKPGMMRAGGMAFESLLQTRTARRSFEAAVLQTGFLEQAFEQILLLLQMGIRDEGETFRTKRWSEKSGNYYIEEMTVTPDDLVNSFELQLDLKSRHRNAGIDIQTRIAEYNAFKDDPYFDPYEIRIRAIEDEEEARRILKSRDEVLKMQAEERDAQMREREMGIQQAAQQQAKAEAQTTGEQALAGAARMGGAA